MSTTKPPSGGTRRPALPPRLPGGKLPPRAAATPASGAPKRPVAPSVRTPLKGQTTAKRSPLKTNFKDMTAGKIARITAIFALVGVFAYASGFAAGTVKRNWSEQSQPMKLKITP